MGFNVSLLHNIVVGFLCGICYGYNCGIISGLSKSLIVCDFFPQYDVHGKLIPDLDGTQTIYRGILTADILVGGMLGSFTGVPIAERFGRKRGLSISSFLGCFALSLAFIDNFWGHVVIRMFVGLCIGAYVTQCPLYVTETIPSEMRGQVGTILQISICFGIFAAQFVNWASKRDYDTGSSDPDKFCVESSVWKLELSLASIPAFLLMIYSIFILPETQKWIEFKRLRQSSARSLSPYSASPSNGVLGSSLNEESEHESEYMQLPGDASPVPSPRIGEDEYDYDAIEIQSPASNLNHYTWKDLLCSRQGLHWTKLAVGLAMSAQLSGINVVIFYSPQIFKDANIKNELIATFIVVGLWNFLSVFVATIIVDRLGRRPLMLAGLSGMTVAAIMLGLVFGVITNQTLKSSFAISAIILFIFGFEIGPGALFFLLASETFPSHVRGKAMTLANVSAWALNIVVSFGFPVVVKIVGSSVTFFSLSFIGLCSVYFIYTSLPETKGTSTE